MNNKAIEMKERAYKSGFPRLSRLIAFISLLTVLGFMTTVLQSTAYSEEKTMQEEVYQEPLDDFESLYFMKVR